MKQPTQTNETEHEAGGRSRTDVERLRQMAEERGGEMWTRLNTWIQDRPLPALATAFAVGFVVSGGLLSRPMLRIARLGARAYMRQFLGGVLGSSASQLISGIIGTDVAERRD